MDNKVSYNLIIDKDRDIMLTVLFNYLMENGGLTGLMQVFKDEGLERVWLDFITEKSDKGHELGFCEDPNCIWEKK